MAKNTKKTSNNNDKYNVFNIVYYYDKNDPNLFKNVEFLKDVKGEIINDECIVPIEWDITNDINEAYKFYEKDNKVMGYLIKNLFDTEFLFDFLEGNDKEIMVQRTVELKTSDNIPRRATGDGHKFFLDYVDNKRTLIMQNVWHSDLHRSNKKIHTYNLNTKEEINNYTYTGAKAIFNF